MINLGNIYSLTEFQRNARSFVNQAKESKQPLVLTVNGRAEVVVQDAETYQRLLDRLEVAEAVADILKSMEEFERGDGASVRVAFEQLKQQYGIPS